MFAVALAIAACGAPDSGSGSSDVPQGSGSYGTVKWPDGKPVPGGHLDFYPQGLIDPYSGITIIGPAGQYFKGQTDAHGVYDASTVCNGVKCPALYTFLAVPWQGGLNNTCEFPLLPQGQSNVKQATPQVTSITPPARLDYVVVNGYCSDIYSASLGVYTDTNANDSYHVLPLNDGSPPPTWQQVEQLMSQGPNASAVGDPCVIGRWVQPSGTLSANMADGNKIQLTGGQGAVLTISSSGTATLDYAPSHPFVGTDNGQSVELYFAGNATSKVRATPPRAFSETLVLQDVTYQFVINGNPQQPQTAPWSAATSYSCSHTAFTETSAGGSQTFVKG